MYFIVEWLLSFVSYSFFHSNVGDDYDKPIITFEMAYENGDLA